MMEHKVRNGWIDFKRDVTRKKLMVHSLTMALKQHIINCSLRRFFYLLTQACCPMGNSGHTLWQDFLTDPRANENSLTCDQVMYLEAPGNPCDSRGTPSLFIFLIPNVLSWNLWGSQGNKLAVCLGTINYLLFDYQPLTQPLCLTKTSPSSYLAKFLSVFSLQLKIIYSCWSDEHWKNIIEVAYDIV